MVDTLGLLAEAIQLARELALMCERSHWVILQVVRFALVLVDIFF